MSDIVVRLRVIGKVQMVGYRAWCVSTATRLKVRGWVRNLKDGSVEAVACGPTSAVNNLITACQTGPRHANVKEVHFSALDASDQDYRNVPETFEQRPDAMPGAPA
jgi:acylphosphatase